MPRPRYKVTKAIKTRVYELARKGLNEEEISKGLRIAYTTFKKHKCQFAPDIKKGREEGDLLNLPIAESALFKRVTGFEYEEVQTKQKGKVVNGKLIDGTIEKTTTKKVVPPDPASAFFYLSNRNKTRWINSMKIEPPPPGDASKKIPIVSRIPKLEKPVNEPPSN
jgi:hypothetical protein